MRRGKRGIGCRRRGGFIRVGSEYYLFSVLSVGDVGVLILGGLVVGASRLWSMNGRWRRRKRLRGGRNNMGLVLSLQALMYRDIDSGGIVYSVRLSRCSMKWKNYGGTGRLMLSTAAWPSPHAVTNTQFARKSIHANSRTLIKPSEQQQLPRGVSVRHPSEFSYRTWRAPLSSD